MLVHKGWGWGWVAGCLLACTAAKAQDAEPAADASTAPATPESAAAIPADGAAPPPSAPAAAGSGSRVVEEIVVTAQKREERLADVPISVQAFSGDKLEALGVKGPMDLPQVT